MNEKIVSVVNVSEAYATEVNLKLDFLDAEENKRKLVGYVPTPSSRTALKGIMDGVYPASRKRVHLVTGTYGTGKSHFGLVLANLVSRDVQDPDLQPLFTKIKEKDPLASEHIIRQRSATKKFLPVLPEPHWDPEGFAHSLLIALTEALRREGVSFTPSSQFTAALDCIQRWRDTEPEAYRRLEEACLRRSRTVEMLIDDLRGNKDTSYRLFQGIHEEVAFGAQFSPLIGLDAADAYQETVNFLKAAGQWQGIFILYDEFGAYLSQMASDPEGYEGSRLQRFAEYCKRSGENQVHLVVIAHQTLKDYAKGKRSEEEWKKIYGRFIDSEYTLSVAAGEHETVDMMDSIVAQRTEGEAWGLIERNGDFSVLSDLARNRGLYLSQSMSWIESAMIRGCYPLHPFATFCLPWIADRVGQEHRSLFTFFGDSTKQGVRHFVETSPIVNAQGRLTLYTVDKLLDYFGKQVRDHADYRHIMLAVDDALSQCGENNLAIRLVKTIAVFELVKHPRLAPRKDVLLEALHVSSQQTKQIEDILEELVKGRVLRYRQATKQYELPRRGGGTADAREAVDKEKKLLLERFDIIAALERKYAPEPIEAMGYAEIHFVRRRAVCQYVRSSHLSNPRDFMERIKNWYAPSRTRYEGDVLVLYVVSDSQADIQSAQNYMVKQACRHPQLIVAVPKSPVAFADFALELEAIERLKGQGLTTEEGTIDRDDLTAIEKEALEGVKDGLADFVRADNLVWYHDGSVVANLEKGGEGRFVSQVLEQVFRKTPLVRDEAMVNPEFIGKSRKDRRDATGALLGIKGPFSIQKQGGPARDRILRACLRQTELLEKVADKGTVEEFEVRDTAPAGSALAEIWQFLRDRVVAPGGKVIEVNGLVQTLLDPPYGLSNQLVEVLLAAFLRNRRDECVLFANVKESKRRRSEESLSQVPLTSDQITAMVARPDDYALFYFEVAPNERHYMDGLVKILGANGTALETYGLWEDCKQILVDWFFSLPKITTSWQRFAEPGTIRLIEVLRTEASAKKAKELLQKCVPEACLGKTVESPDAAVYQETLEAFARIYEELANQAHSIETLLVQELSNVFGASGTTQSDFREAVQQWYNDKLTEAQRLHTFGGDEGHLKLAVEREAPIVQRMLHQLPMGMGLGVFTDWDEDHTALFVTRVRLAKRSIEAWQPKEEKRPPTGDLPASVLKATSEIRAILDAFEIPPEYRREILESLLRELRS